VHLNPVHVKRHSTLEVKEKRKIIGSYRWSSYSGYSRQKDRQSFVDYSKILRMIGGRSERDARRHYSRFVISGIFKKMDMKVWEEVKGQAILGSEEFVDWVRERFLSKEKGNIREHPALKALKGGPRSVEEMIFFFMVKFLLSLIAAASLQTAHSLCHRLNLDG